jgi:hypothetical protein
MYVKGTEWSNCRAGGMAAPATGGGAGVAKRCYLELSRECSLLFGWWCPPLPPTSSPTLPPPGRRRAAAAAVRSLIVCSPWWASATAANRHAAPHGGVVACFARRRLWPRRCRGAWPLCSSWQEQLPGGALRAVLQYTVGIMLNILGCVFLACLFGIFKNSILVQ